MIDQYTDVTPEWARPHVKPGECSILKGTDGDWFVMDHSIQTVVATATSQRGCYLFMNSLKSALCPHCGLERMWDGGGWWCPLLEEDLMDQEIARERLAA